MATSAFCAVARMAFPSRWTFRNMKTPTEITNAIPKLIMRLLPTTIDSAI